MTPRQPPEGPPGPVGANARPGLEAAALTSTFYEELRRIARGAFARERTGHTLQPTAVVNEACMRLMANGLPDLPRDERLAIAGRVLRQVLVDHARSRGAAKRGGLRECDGNGACLRLDLDRDVLADQRTQIDFDAVHRAIERLRDLNTRQADVVELRVFSGLTMEQAAGVLGVSKRTAEADWTVARAWLRRELSSALHTRGDREP
jgi:RNA polymerase sigma-70 factor (ECF subfamily)